MTYRVVRVGRGAVAARIGPHPSDLRHEQGASGDGERHDKFWRCGRRDRPCDRADSRFADHRTDRGGTAVFRADRGRWLSVRLPRVAVLAIVGAVYFWYLWFLTAKTCIDTYIRQDCRIDHHPSRTCYFVASQTHRPRHLVVFGVDLGLAVYASGVCGEQEHDSVLSARRLGVFRTSLPQCVVYGRVRDTLRSLRLAGHAAELPAGGRVTNVELHRRLRAGAGQPTVRRHRLNCSKRAQAFRAAAQETAKADEGTSATDELSTQIFLLLCASLVSTFVGTGVAYMVTPSLNWLNERAIGLHQLGQADPGFAAEEFFRQVDPYEPAVGQFDTTTVRMCSRRDTSPASTSMSGRPPRNSGN